MQPINKWSEWSEWAAALPHRVYLFFSNPPTLPSGIQDLSLSRFFLYIAAAGAVFVYVNDISWKGDDT